MDRGLADWQKAESEDKEVLVRMAAGDYGVPQGSVLGPQLFTISVNNLEERIEGIVTKFADDTKICKGTGGIEEAGGLQKDLDRLGEWAKKWQMEYNVEKYDVMHFG